MQEGKLRRNQKNQKETPLRLSGGHATLHTWAETHQEGRRLDMSAGEGADEDERRLVLPSLYRHSRCRRSLELGCSTRFSSARLHSSTRQTLVTTKEGDGQAVQCPASPCRQPAGLGSVPAVAYSSGPVCSPAAARDLQEMTMTRQSGRHPAQFRASVIDAGWLSESLFWGVCSCI
ncbi:hypothetical protein LY76DRAFT_364418 [Colletotrichum caudatum]|nr:hypothetical protein LY76DRAFT_364418 [Colletotrichum caudatum]